MKCYEMYVITYLGVQMIAGLTKLVLYDQIRGLGPRITTEEVAVYLVSHHTLPILYAMEDMFIRQKAPLVRRLWFHKR